MPERLAPVGLMGRIYVALANGQSYEEAPIPHTTHTKQVWEECERYYNEAKAKGLSIDLSGI